MKLHLIKGNREVTTSRVNESYNRIKSNGYLKEVGKIEYVTGSCLEGKKILSAKVAKKDNSKPLSLSNWMLEMEEIQYTQDVKVCVDGQGRLVALMLMQMIDGDNTIDNESIYREVTVPDVMDVVKFVLLKNSGIPWNYANVQNANISSGNEFIDELDRLAKYHNIKNQVVYDFATIKTGDLTCNIVKKMKEQTRELPSSVTLNAKSIEVASNLLDIIKDHPMLTKDHITTRFSKGLKLFCKNYPITNVEDVYRLIGAITKPLWEQHFSTANGVSAEAKKYSEGFMMLYEQINLQETAPISQPTVEQL